MTSSKPTLAWGRVEKGGNRGDDDNRAEDANAREMRAM